MLRWHLTLVLVIVYFFCFFSPACAADSNIELSAGWNFISVPVTHPLYQNLNNQNYSLFSNINTAGHSIWRYNAETDNWDKLYPGSNISPSDGIWIYSDNATSVTVYGDNLDVPAPKPVYPGWNAVGFAGSELPAYQAFSALGDKWLIAIQYNSVLQQYDRTILNSDPSRNSPVEPGKAYWIFVNGSAEYTLLPVTGQTSIPTTIPTTEPTTIPTTAPTTIPTTIPTTVPIIVQTTIPTTEPTTIPTTAPTTIPTTIPTTVPIIVQTTIPTTDPTIVPTTDPTIIPTTIPTAMPTTIPTWCGCGCG